MTIKKGNRVIIIINLIKCEVATLDKSDFSYSAKINNGPKAPGAAEKIDVLPLYFANFSRYFDTIKILIKIMK